MMLHSSVGAQLENLYKKAVDSLSVVTGEGFRVCT